MAVRSGVELGGSSREMVLWLGVHPAAPRCPSWQAVPALPRRAGTRAQHMLGWSCMEAAARRAGCPAAEDTVSAYGTRQVV